MKSAAPKRKPPSRRTVQIAAKVLASDGVLPARLQVKDGSFWTLQWSELAALSRATLSGGKGKGRK